MRKELESKLLNLRKSPVKQRPSESGIKQPEKIISPEITMKNLLNTVRPKTGKKKKVFFKNSSAPKSKDDTFMSKVNNFEFATTNEAKHDQALLTERLNKLFTKQHKINKVKTKSVTLDADQLGNRSGKKLKRPQTSRPKKTIQSPDNYFHQNICSTLKIKEKPKRNENLEKLINLKEAASNKQEQDAAFGNKQQKGVYARSVSLDINKVAVPTSLSKSEIDKALLTKSLTGFQKRNYYKSIFKYPELNCQNCNKLDLNFEERKEYEFVMGILIAKKKTPQFLIPSQTLQQTANQERSRISYKFRHKNKIEKSIEEYKAKKNMEIQQEKINTIQKYDKIQKQIEGKDLIKPFNEMYTKYYKDYDTLERIYNEKKELEEKNRLKGTSNKFITHLSATQKAILKIDRDLLEKTSKTIKNIGKFVNPSSKLMVINSKKDHKEANIEKKQKKEFIRRNSGLNYFL